MRKELLRKLTRDFKKAETLSEFARGFGIPRTTMYRLLHGQSYGNIRVWEKIEKHYGRSA